MSSRRSQPVGRLPCASEKELKPREPLTCGAPFDCVGPPIGLVIAGAGRGLGLAVALFVLGKLNREDSTFGGTGVEGPDVPDGPEDEADGSDGRWLFTDGAVGVIDFIGVDRLVVRLMINLP